MRKRILQLSTLLAATWLLTVACQLAWSQASRKPASNSQQKAVLVGVHARGSQRYPKSDIAAATGLKVGTTVTPQDFNTAANELVASGAFEEVKYRYEPARTGYVVTFEVSDTDQFLPVSYDNFVWFSDQQLNDAVHQRFPLFKGEVSTTSGMLEKVTDVLQALLADRGVAGTVRFVQEGTFGRGKFEGKINGGVFTIEGLDVTIREVNFPGASDSDLPDLRKKAEQLLKMPYQRSIAAAFAENNLRPFYSKRGYLKAAFGAPEMKLVKEDVQAPEVSLSIPVQPGAQYRIATIRWWGNKVFYPEDLQKQLSVRAGGVADAVQIESDLDKIRTLYARKGYLRAAIAANPAFDDSDNTVSYEFALHEGDVYRLHEVEISGAGLSKDTLARLREAWQMREGEPYDAGYEREYLKVIGRVLAPNVTVEVNKDINDERKTVDVNMDFVVHADKVIRENTK